MNRFFLFDELFNLIGFIFLIKCEMIIIYNTINCQKEKFLFKTLVFQKTHKQLSNESDKIELSKGIIIDEESTEIFLTKNQRWAQMYKLLVFQFCRDFAEKCKL